MFSQTHGIIERWLLCIVAPTVSGNVKEAAAWLHEVEGLSNEEKQRLMVRLEQAVWAFPRSLTRHLLSEQEDQEDFARDCRERLRPDLAEDLIVARHKPTRALYEVTCAISEFPFNDANRRITAMDKSTTVLCNSLGNNERLATRTLAFYRIQKYSDDRLGYHPESESSRRRDAVKRWQATGRPLP